MVSDILVAVLHGRSPCVPNQLRLFGGACGGKELRAGLCNMVSGCVKESVVGTIPRLLGEKNFSVQEERSGGSTGEILELKGLRYESCRPQTFCITAGPVRAALFPRCAHPSRCATKEHKVGVLRAWWESASGRALQRCKNERAALDAREKGCVVSPVAPPPVYTL